MRNKYTGKFIVFEGLDGSGKTTQIEHLAERLRKLGHSVYITREPTDSVIGQLIQQHMIHVANFDEETVAALFVADRLNHILNRVDGILEKIENNITVISDRYYFSSYAYHSVHIPMDWVIQANSLAQKILPPDLNIFIDVPPEICIKRITSNRTKPQRYEKVKHLEEVLQKYQIAFERLRDYENIAYVDGTNDFTQVSNDIGLQVQILFSAEEANVTRNE